MAKTACSTPTPITTRRTLGAGLFATIIGSGITAGAAASVADLVPADPDAELIALRHELQAAVADVSRGEMVASVSDEEVSAFARRLGDVCWAIIDAPPAQTSAGRALKAAAAMHELRDSFNHGAWPGDGEAMAWDVLSELAGNAYVPPTMPERIRHLCEPERA